MAKQKPPKSEADSEKANSEKAKTARIYKSAPVQVKPDLADMIGVIADYDDVTQYDLLDPILRQWVLTQYERVLALRSAELQAAKRNQQ